MTEGAFDPGTLEAVGELLALAAREGFGITFAPGPDGWTIGYLRGMRGDDLLTGLDLGDLARAAVVPLLDLAASSAQAPAELPTTGS
jgi:hypothetical protein